MLIRLEFILPEKLHSYSNIETKQEVTPRKIVGIEYQVPLVDYAVVVCNKKLECMCCSI